MYSDKKPFKFINLDQLAWDFSHKHRRSLLSLVLILIILVSVYLSYQFIQMQLRIKQLSAVELIHVLAVKEDINIGELIQAENLYPKKIVKQEFDKSLIYKENEKGEVEEEYAYISCQIDENENLIISEELQTIVGRVAKLPIISDSFIHKKHLADPETLAGLKNIIAPQHSLVDVSTSQDGHHVYLRPGDTVDLYSSSKSKSELLAHNIEIILADSLAQGKAPMQVSVNSKAQRNFTLAIPDSKLSVILKAIRDRSIMLSLANHDFKEKHEEKQARQVFPQNQFQELIFIKGQRKEIFKQ